MVTKYHFSPEMAIFDIVNRERILKESFLTKIWWFQDFEFHHDNMKSCHCKYDFFCQHNKILFMKKISQKQKMSLFQLIPIQICCKLWKNSKLANLWQVFSHLIVLWPQVRIFLKLNPEFDSFKTKYFFFKV